jgi:hypothetical protein
VAPANDPLDDPGEGMFVSPSRRRIAIAFGLLMLVLILVGLAWFAVTHTGTADAPGSLLGRSGAAVGSVLG